MVKEQSTNPVTRTDAPSEQVEKSPGVRAVEAAYQAFDSGDLDAFVSLLGKGFVSTQSDAVPWRGRHVGPAGVRTMFDQMGERATARYVPEELIDDGERVVVVGRAEITPGLDGRTWTVRELHLWGVEFGTLTSLDVFLNAPGALLAALDT
ncbi:hypothetical protein ASG90_04185 [Nocardioides sp. Soil797]|nr:hypothetical protein ASG90_04185 [Nocardioides sp. Soil797]